ncbi:antibiotic ABC transporter substrate-binding protein [Delftia sp. 670]|uniref:Fe2+-enterobactin ABC transporter substrate-binding protein n=1 Tax=Delftia TaxID=80865 RepID=UPI0004D7F82B|nr:Fe2+-enterobactin ABC transporter substrate-binding protein [Delftia lacustris]KEH12044.1 antibiotic ABC transporter substrate-binding protein [Delftia sp. 670]BDE72220.1 iron-enterobactin transporter periplasmic-binding protein [Delftia lacustris]
MNRLQLAALGAAAALAVLACFAWFPRAAVPVAGAAPHTSHASDASGTPAAAHADHAPLPRRIVSTSPSVTGILLAIDAPVVATAATTPSRMTDDKGFFSQWAAVADKRGVQVLYRNLQFDIEAAIGASPDLLVASATGADSVAQHRTELQAQGVPMVVVDYSSQSWQDIATELGRITGHAKEAAAAIARFDAHVAQTAASIMPPAQPVSIVAYNMAGSYSIARAASPHARLLAALGFKVEGLPPALAAQVTRASDFEFISRENLSAAITGDSVFLLGASQGDVQAFLDDPLLANLPAVAGRRVYPLGPTSFRIDYYSGQQMVDAVASHFR